ncbi:polysaccharide deacetylase family protein [Adhaeribacter soli]|uniref:Polysaccharide deacetylase family protein n=1 Tax=Adhaeribacter soli TaxID=2607655 RepID=A0A5N1J2J0_9BACT|nr:hypothetical protein [Adhaeribacter soli]KAA9340716.1 hypothetical protein F0P94_04625 [Adhaeribacter soli]
MNIYVTYDYELCFGGQTGTIEKCMLEPTYKLMQLAKLHQAHFTFFVDVLYLMKLKEYSFIDTLAEEFQAIKKQLEALIEQGHDVQLHLHTHWINARYDGEWNLDLPNYRIHKFTTEEINKIVGTSVKFLEDITKQKVFAFRAGGWCLQPFDKLKEAFANHGVWLDSTVFYKGYNHTPTNLYDFRKSPDLDLWKFDDDPLKIEADGAFTELPITSCAVSPLFYWKTVFFKKLFPKKHAVIGDGTFLRSNKAQMVRLLLTPSHAVVSCDGYRSSLLEPTFKAFSNTSKANFVVIGHPKLMSAYSLDKLESFIFNTTKQGHRFTSIHEVFGAPKTEEALTQANSPTELSNNP